LSAFYTRYAGGGARNQPFHPLMMLPAEIERREVRLKAITEARRRLEQRQPRGGNGRPEGGRCKHEFGVPEAKAQDNFTDPDSRIMKRAGDGFDASCNAQAAVDDTAHLIVAAELGNNAADAQLLPTLQAVKANTGEWPRQGLADAGYRSEANFEQLAGLPIELVVALGREGKSLAQVEPAAHPHTAAMAAKLQAEAGKTAWRRRKWLAEPPNGWIQSVLGFCQFSLRGLHRVRAESKLVCLALNLRRMGAMQAA